MSADPPTVHVFDADGALLRSLPDEAAAHEFAHEQAKLPGTRLPLEVEHRPDRTVRFVWPNRCGSKRWMACDRPWEEPCPMLPTPLFASWPAL